MRMFLSNACSRCFVLQKCMLVYQGALLVLGIMVFNPMGKTVHQLQHRHLKGS